ncbi:hypothetical protein AB0O07_25950 [Streptomyces sp. NPDC093085]|uniref:hypothetical protein n=1 Tax=Streptomyces sp. NPDC093085 TaxID=3155068 RepID=UPI003420242F
MYVPRCARCHTGHQIEVASAVFFVAALIAYAGSGQLDRLLGILPASGGERTAAALWAAGACLPGLAWIAVRHARLPWHRLAPRRRGYAYHHPEVIQLRDDDWRLRPGPFPYWGTPPNPHLPPRPGRLRRAAGHTADLIAASCFLAAPINYFQGYDELAGVLIAASAALAFLSSKLKPGR